MRGGWSGCSPASPPLWGLSAVAVAAAPAGPGRRGRPAGGPGRATDARRQGHALGALLGAAEVVAGNDRTGLSVHAGAVVAAAVFGEGMTEAARSALG